MPKHFFLLLASTSLVVPHAFAADDEVHTIPKIVITATRSPTDLGKIASSMTVITQEQIERQNKPTVTELLREVPGMSIASNGGPGQTSRVFMRGTNSSHVLVIMDGVMLNDPSDPNDAFDFANLSTENIERIEILRGAQSTLYGSQAIGGVINIISKKGQGAPRYNGRLEYGSFDTSREGAGVQGESDGLSYGFQASNFHTNGISSMAKRFGGIEKDGSSIYTLAGNFAKKITEQFTAKLNLRYNRNDTEFDSPSSFIRPHDDTSASNDSRQLSGRIAGEYSALENQWKQEMSVSRLALNRSQVTEFYEGFTAHFGHQQYISWRDKIDWVHHVTLIPNHSVTFGAEAQSEHYKYHNLMPQLSLAELNVDNQAFFIDDQVDVTQNLFLNAGIRTDNHQSFGRKTTWKVAPGYRIAQTGTVLKASYGTGFQAPSLYSLNDITYGNPSLKPETSKSYDAGFEQSLWDSKLTFGATLFRNDIRGLLDTVETSTGSGVYKYVNIGKARTQGAEASLEVRPSVDWKITGNYTFTQADDRSAGKRLKRRPKHLVNIASDWQYSQEGDVGINIRHSGLSMDSDFSFAYVKTKPFTTLDLYSNYKITPAATAYARIDNLLDKRYEEIYGYGQPGLAVYGGVKVGF